MNDKYFHLMNDKQKEENKIPCKLARYWKTKVFLDKNEEKT